MLDRISYPAFTLTTLTKLTEALAATALQAHPTEPSLLLAKEKIDDALARAETAATAHSDSSFNRQVRSLDEVRDACYRGLRNHVKAGTDRVTNRTYKSAADNLLKVFTKNNLLLGSLPPNEQTLAMEKLFESLKSMSDELTQLKVHDWVAELEEANERFKKLTQGREIDSSFTSDDDVVAKAALNSALRTLVSNVNALAAEKKLNGIDRTVDELNTIIATLTEKEKAS